MWPWSRKVYYSLYLLIKRRQQSVLSLAAAYIVQWYTKENGNIEQVSWHYVKRCVKVFFDLHMADFIMKACYLKHAI